MEKINIFNSNQSTNVNDNSIKQFEQFVFIFGKLREVNNEIKNTFDIHKNIVQKHPIINYDINELFSNSQNTQNSGQKVKNIGILQAKKIENMESNIVNGMISSTTDFNLQSYSLQNNGVSLLNNYEGHTERINDIGIINDHNAFTSVSNDGTVKIWDLKGGNKCVKTFNIQRNVWSVASHKDLLCAGIDSNLVIWNLKTLKASSKVNFLHSATILSINIQEIKGIPYLISTGDDYLVQIVDISQPITMDSNIITVNPGKSCIKAEILDDNMKYLMLTTCTESLEVYNIETSKQIFSIDLKQEELDLNYVIDAKLKYKKNVENTENEFNISLKAGSWSGRVINGEVNFEEQKLYFDEFIETNVNQKISSIINFDKDINIDREVSVLFSDEGGIYIC